MLAERGVPVGVVTGIVGYARGELVLEGRAGHAGTTPMVGRDDALVAAAAQIQRVRDAALAIPGAVATIGEVEVEPGAGNVIPSRVCDSASTCARPTPSVSTTWFGRSGSSRGTASSLRSSQGRLHRRSATQSRARGLPVVELASGAGHDAGILASAGVDAAMLFVRSLNGGISHSPDELSSDEDVALAVDVLA